MTVTAAVVAWAGFLATAATAGYTYLLAYRARQTLDETRKQRKLAEGQANSARESAEAASKQAHAAIRSALAAQEQVDLTRTSQHRADQPRFELSSEKREGSSVLVAARMVAGPPEVQAYGRWKASASAWDDEHGETRRIDHHEGFTTLHSVVLGDHVIVRVIVPEWAERSTIRLDLTCTDVADDSRSWVSPAVMDWELPPVPQW